MPSCIVPTTLLLLLLLLLVTLQCSYAYPAQTSYCAAFNPRTSSGVAGFFAATINTAGGQAYYDFSINLNQYVQASTDTKCDLSKGLKYHIHSYWSNSSTSAFGNTYCGGSQTGAHYDPDFACGPYSQYASAPTALCQKIYRTTPKYKYPCNSTVFASGDLDGCEVGDLNGKFGATFGVSGVYLPPGGAVLVDPLPPRVLDYRSSKVLITNYTAPWQSIVFHCNDGKTSPPTRLFCAKFTTTLGSCQALGANFVPLSSEPAASKSYSPSQFGGAIAGASIICTLGGLMVGILFTRYQHSKTPSPDNSDSNNPMHKDAIPDKRQV